MSIKKRIISMIFCALMTIGMFGCASGYNASNDNGTFNENGNRIDLVMENDIPTSFAYNAKTDRWHFSFGYRGVSSVRSDWMSWESGRPSLNS